MKTLHFILFALSAAPAAHAETSCSGYLQMPGSFLNGTCSGTNCSSFVSGQYFSGSIGCSSQITARVQGNLPGGFENAQCNGNSVSFYIQGQWFSFRGTCSNGRSFSGDGQTYGDFVNGSCTENGSFSAFVSSQQLQVRGSCQ